MKKYHKLVTRAAVASCVVFTTLAQDNNRTTQTLEQKDTAGAQFNTSSTRTGRLGPSEKANKVIGMEVKNSQNEKLGKVDDLAVDLSSGRIVTAVLSIGGFLGLGDTLVAVPPSALHYDAANKVFHFDADKEKLKAAPRFEYSKWDDSTQASRIGEVYAYFGEQPYFSASVNTDRNKDAKLGAHSDSRLGYVQRASKLMGMSVKNLQEEKLGKVDNFIIDLPAGRILTVVLSSGGFLGLGDELSAVPPTALRYNEARDTVLLDTTKDALAKAPHFKSNEWPEMSESYANTVYGAYNVEPYYNSSTSAGFNTTVRNDANNSRVNVRDRNNQTLTPGDQGNNSADIDVTKQIRKEIIASKDMSVSARNVKIITTNGRVTLRGPVKTEDEKRLIGEIAARIATPQNVDNQLEVRLTPTGSQ